jgi:epoxyqueuosine reductase
MHPKASLWTAKIKSKAAELGFAACGVSQAGHLDEEARRLEAWLLQGFEGDMNYMSRNFDLRVDPTKLVPGAKSVVSLLFNYYSEPVETKAPFKVSRYAYGRDYHKVLKKKLKKLMAFIQEEIGEVEGRCFVDSAPVLERAWAAKSGLGWIGKNTMLLRKGAGSWFFLCELIIDLELIPDGPVKDYCGTCTKCIDACPTNAIHKPYEVDGSRCISYFTIETKADKLPAELRNSFGEWVFGCDICQEVCPINSRAKNHNEEDFQLKTPWPEWTEKEWLEITDEIFEQTFRGTPVMRTGLEGLKRNVRFLKPEDPA